jgi:hypothetical protein
MFRTGANDAVGEIKGLILDKGQLVGYVAVQPGWIGATWDQSTNNGRENTNATKMGPGR